MPVFFPKAMVKQSNCLGADVCMEENIFLEHTGRVVIVVVVLAGLLGLLLDRRMSHCPVSYIYIDGLSDVFFKNWRYLIASSTVASLTSTFLGQNLLKAVAYSPFTGWSSGLILSLYCDGCLSTSWILYSCSLLTSPCSVTDTLTGFSCWLDLLYPYPELLLLC